MKMLGKLKPRVGSTSARNRVGRGIGSGFGKTAGRGYKGQRARSGGKKGLRGFEGGQMPLQRRLPKHGFTNVHAIPTAVITTETLNRLDDGSRITLKLLQEKRLIVKRAAKVKLILKGEITKKFTVALDNVSKGAALALTAKGGTVEKLA